MTDSSFIHYVVDSHTSIIQYEILNFLDDVIVSGCRRTSTSLSVLDAQATAFKLLTPVLNYVIRWTVILINQKHFIAYCFRRFPLQEQKLNEPDFYPFIHF